MRFWARASRLPKRRGRWQSSRERTTGFPDRCPRVRIRHSRAPEIHELYALNAKLTAEDENVLHSELPDLGAFPSAKDFAALYDELSELARMSLKTGAEFWLNDDQNTATLRELLQALTHAGETLATDAAGELLESDADWIRDCLEAGRVGGERAQSWRELRELIEACSSDTADKEPLTLEYGPSVEGDIPQSELAETCRAILKHFESGRELSKLALIRHPEWGDLIASTRVDTGAPAEALHFQAILHHLEIRAWRERLGQRWDRQMLPFGLPEFAALGPAPEREARRYAEGIAAGTDVAPRDLVDVRVKARRSRTRLDAALEEDRQPCVAQERAPANARAHHRTH